MIFGIGVDIVHTPRIKRLMESWGEDFKRRVFTEKEIEYAERHKISHQRYASSFAVKEAFFKALGRGFRGKIHLRDIETLRDEEGKPHVNVRKGGEEMIRILEINSIHASISHDGDYTIALVILEKSG